MERDQTYNEEQFEQLKQDLTERAKEVHTEEEKLASISDDIDEIQKRYDDITRKNQEMAKIIDEIEKLQDEFEARVEALEEKAATAPENADEKSVGVQLDKIDAALNEMIMQVDGCKESLSTEIDPQLIAHKKQLDGINKELDALE